MDDSIYPNDGSYYQPSEPEEQATTRQQEINEAQAAKPMLQHLLDDVRGDIAKMNSIDAITVPSEVDPSDFMRNWYAVQETLKYARTWESRLEDLLKVTR